MLTTSPLRSPPHNLFSSHFSSTRASAQTSMVQASSIHQPTKRSATTPLQTRQHSLIDLGNESHRFVVRRARRQY
jgi:hypothetical protein